MEKTGGIEVFRKTHYKEDSGWVNTTAQLDYEKMLEEVKKPTQESGDPSSVNEIECMKCALGPRRGHIKGVGRVVRHPTPCVTDTYPTLQEQGQWQNQMDERVEKLQQQLQEQNLQQQERERERDRAMEAVNKQMEEMRRLLERKKRRKQ